MLTLHPTPAAPADGEAPATTEAWSRLWFTLAAQGWGSLALVPADPEGSALAVARALAAEARAYDDGAVHVLDAEWATAAEVRMAMATVAARVAAGERVLVVLPSPLRSAPAIPLARAADAALLVVPLGEAAVGPARRTVAAVGAAQFLGSVAVQAA